jgi:hypothetical protein
MNGSLNRMKKSLIRLMDQVLFPTASLILISACATQPIRISQNDRIELKKETAFSTVCYKTDLDILMYESAVAANFGLVGAVINATVYASPQDRVRAMVKEPAKDVGNRFLDWMDSTAKRAPSAVAYNPVNPTPSNDDVSAIAGEARDPMVWEFKTLHWLLQYHPLDFDSYHLKFRLRARLISKRDARVIWQGVCDYPGNETDYSRTSKQVFEGDAITEMETAAVSSCVKQLRDQFAQQ